MPTIVRAKTGLIVTRPGISYLCTVHVSENEQIVCSNHDVLIQTLRSLEDTARLYRIEYRKSGEHRDGTRRILLHMAERNALPRS